MARVVGDGREREYKGLDDLVPDAQVKIAAYRDVKPGDKIWYEDYASGSMRSGTVVGAKRASRKKQADDNNFAVGDKVAVPDGSQGTVVDLGDPQFPGEDLVGVVLDEGHGGGGPYNFKPMELTKVMHPPGVEASRKQADGRQWAKDDYDDLSDEDVLNTAKGMGYVVNSAAEARYLLKQVDPRLIQMYTEIAAGLKRIGVKFRKRAVSVGETVRYWVGDDKESGVVIKEPDPNSSRDVYTVRKEDGSEITVPAMSIITHDIYQDARRKLSQNNYVAAAKLMELCDKLCQGAMELQQQGSQMMDPIIETCSNMKEHLLAALGEMHMMDAPGTGPVPMGEPIMDEAKRASIGSPMETSDGQYWEGSSVSKPSLTTGTRYGGQKFVEIAWSSAGSPRPSIDEVEEFVAELQELIQMARQEEGKTSLQRQLKRGQLRGQQLASFDFVNEIVTESMLRSGAVGESYAFIKTSYIDDLLGMDYDQAEDFYAWLEENVSQEEQHIVEQEIHQYLRSHPGIIGTKSWDEIAVMANIGELHGVHMNIVRKPASRKHADYDPELPAGFQDADFEMRDLRDE